MDELPQLPGPRAAARSHGSPGGPLRLRVLLEPRHRADCHAFRTLDSAAERLGYGAFFRSDHRHGVDPRGPTHRAERRVDHLAGPARHTRRIRLGTLLTAAPFRSPGLLAVIVAAVDTVSGGRVGLQRQVDKPQLTRPDRALLAALPHRLAPAPASQAAPDRAPLPRTPCSDGTATSCAAGMPGLPRQAQGTAPHRSLPPHPGPAACA